MFYPTHTSLKLEEKIVAAELTAATSKEVEAAQSTTDTGMGPAPDLPVVHGAGVLVTTSVGDNREPHQVGR